MATGRPEKSTIFEIIFVEKSLLFNLLTSTTKETCVFLTEDKNFSFKLQ